MKTKLNLYLQFIHSKESECGCSVEQFANQFFIHIPEDKNRRRWVAGSVLARMEVKGLLIKTTSFGMLYRLTINGIKEIDI